MTQGRTTLVTGAGIGIGRAAAFAFARAGHHVVVTDILEAEGHAVVAAIRAAGGSASFAAMDVRSTRQVDEVVAAVTAERGAIDALVLNAGIAHKVPLERLDDERWDHTVDIDLKGMFRVARAALPAMRARRSGAIVCLTSLMGVAWGWREHVHYSAAKAGVIGLNAGWRRRWRPTACASTRSRPATCAPRSCCPRSTRWARPASSRRPAACRSGASASRRTSPM